MCPAVIAVCSGHCHAAESTDKAAAGCLRLLRWPWRCILFSTVVVVLQGWRDWEVAGLAEAQLPCCPQATRTHCLDCCSTNDVGIVILYNDGELQTPKPDTVSTSCQTTSDDAPHTLKLLWWTCSGPYSSSTKFRPRGRVQHVTPSNTINSGNLS